MSNLDLMELDNINLSFFSGLLRKHSEKVRSKNFWIYEKEVTPPTDCKIVYPTALIDRDAELKNRFRNDLQTVSYSSIKQSEKKYSQFAKNAAIWLRRLQAGTGSSLHRPVSEGKKIGAKGTDLKIDIDGKLVSLAEAQMIRALYDHSMGLFAEIHFHDLISSETRDSISEMWNKKSFCNSSYSYEEQVQKTDGLFHSGETLQQHAWTINEEGNLTPNRKAPAGHGLFAQDALRAAIHPKRRPATNKSLVGVIGNGEDLGAPDEYMIGYVLNEKIPIAIVTTEKTAADGKGGILALVESSPRYLTILETAQAEKAHQLDLYKSLGGEANTNLVLLNYDELTPLFEKYIADFGLEEFERSIIPDLIENWKIQTDTDGVRRKYLQLEGATGSVVMNLDHAFRKAYGKPLVHIITVPLKDRCQFFSPVKTAFDFFMQFHSDRFTLMHDAHSKLFKLKNLGGDLPVVSLSDPVTHDRFYNDLDCVLSAFKNTHILRLNSLHLIGQFDLSGTELIGDISLTNHSNKRISAGDLVSIYKAPHRTEHERIVFENLNISISKGNAT
jgi:hypothetical protein